MKWFLLVLSAAFFGTLTAVVGERAVAETHALVMGIVCGVGASVPASIMAAWLARRPESPPRPLVERAPGAYAPVVMVTGRESLRAADAPTLPLPQGGAAGARPYRVVGEE